MTDEELKMLKRINDYAEKELADIDPQKTPVSFQLEKLRPVMEEIAAEKGCDLQDIFISYMDLASEAAASRDAKMRESLKDLNEGGEDGLPPLLYR
jgi:hypothetical protein